MDNREEEKIVDREMFNGDELAISVWKSKYALEDESHYDQMHKRMAKQFARVEAKYSNLDTTAVKYNALSQYGKISPTLTEEVIYLLFKDFKYIVPQGSIMSQLGSGTIGSLSNCFVVGQPVDSYGGIFQKDEEMAQLMKRRGGVGIDLSTLRPAGAPTSNVAKSSTGAASFMHRFSNTTREVAQNGRRGALMLSMDVTHPDILSFVKMKRDLTQVTGANISVKLNDDFMNAVTEDADYVQSFSQGNELLVQSASATNVWNEIIKSAHSVAEPGLMFWDNMVNYSPDGCYPQFKQVTTNPCSEIAMQPYDACRLIAVNLTAFVKNPFTKEAYFDFNEFYQVNYQAMRLSDDLIDLELEHIDRILQKIYNDPEEEELKRVEFNLWNKVRETASASRRTGLGFTGLGDVFAMLGVGYDSDLALRYAKGIMKAKLESELDCTTDLAILRGTFKGWDRNREDNPFYAMLQQEFPQQYARMERYGRRNVSWSTINGGFTQ